MAQIIWRHMWMLPKVESTRTEFRTSSGFRSRLMAFFRSAVAHKNESKFQRCVWIGWCNIAIVSHCFSRELTSIFFEVTNFYFWHGSLHFQTKILVLLNHADIPICTLGDVESTIMNSTLFKWHQFCKFDVPTGSV